MTRAANRKRKNYLKQVDLVASDILSPYNDADKLKAKIKTLVNGMDSDNDNTRAESEEEFTNIARKIATPEYYEYLEGYLQAYEKTDLYKACIYANNSCDRYEWEQIIHGFERIVESALYKINELN